MPFEIFPAIDLRGGRVVRLRQGDFAQETVYDDSPPLAASDFVEAGAHWLHVVDLDGARSGIPAHETAIAAIVAAVGGRARVEVAGGLRHGSSIAAVLATGVARAVVGTAALADPSFAGRLIEAHGPDHIAGAIDVRDGLAVGHGWISSSAGVEATEAIERLADAGIETFEVTAIERDGVLDGPDLGLYARLVDLGRGKIIASGGVATVDHLRAIRDIGCVGAIVGRALYEGRLDLRQTIEALSSGD